MKDLLHLALIQPNIIWEAIDENIKQYSEIVDSLTSEVDLIVLPEMFSTGFTMNPEKIAETMEGKSVTWMQEVASKLDAAVMGSLVIADRGDYFNRVVFVYPNGSIRLYDKRHLFTLSGEDEKYTQGNEVLVLDYKGWRICPMICYDLRFPVWSRNTREYDVLVYMANWPKPRIIAWDTLLKARAIENMSYVVGVNRVGADENGYEFIGHSQVIDSLGTVVAYANENKECVLRTTLNKNELNSVRNKFQFLNDKDSFEIY